MPRNRTASDTRPILSESDSFESIPEPVRDDNLSSLKQLLLQRAWEYWNVKQNEKYAIFYQTISFCLQSNCATQANEELFSYIEKLKKEISFQASAEKPVYNYSNFEDVNKYLDREISSACRHQFPKEWTVIQMCKNYNPVTLSSKFDDIVNYNTGISLTIFKHAAVKDLLMLEIKKQSHSPENIFEKCYKLNKKITESLNFTNMPKDTTTELRESKEKYWAASKEMETYIQDMVNLLKSFIGPWIVVFSGNFKSRKSVETENAIRQKVYEFLKSRNFTENQEKLIHLLARRTDLLSHQQIFVAITYVLRDKQNLGYNDIDLNNLYDHLTWIKQEFVYDDVSTYPCILIVDELLDQMPFEMLNTQQEFTRVCSFGNLKRLYERYCGSMVNGYLAAPMQNCQAIINPDGTLKLMEDRMKNFFNYWLPSWKLKLGQKPSKEDFYETLAQTDAVLLSGHNSVMSLSYDNIHNLKTKAVVFLFGCGSTSLASSGLHSEMKGAHFYYHIGWSPVVIGFLWTITDFHADYCCSKMLSAFCNSNQSKAHWQCIDKATWRKNGNLAFTRVGDIISSDSLSEITAKLHSDNDLPISIRASLVYRGLPVINSTK